MTKGKGMRRESWLKCTDLSGDGSVEEKKGEEPGADSSKAPDINLPPETRQLDDDDNDDAADNDDDSTSQGKENRGGQY